MNKDINRTLGILKAMLWSQGEHVASIEAVRSTFGGATKEVAEITYDNGYRKYVDIDCDSNLAAVMDVLKVVLDMEPGSAGIGHIERGIYDRCLHVDIDIEEGSKKDE